MSRRGWLLFGLMCVIWGVPYLMIRVAVEELTPATLVFARTALAAVILLPLAFHRGDLSLLRRYRRPLIAFAVVELAIPWLLLAHAEEHLSSSLTGLLLASVPLVGAALARFTGADDRLTRRRMIGLGLGVVGVAAIVGLDASGINPLSVGELFIVAVCYASGPIILSRWLSDLPGLGVIAASLTLTAIVYLPVAISQRPASVPSEKVIWSVIGLAVICTAIAFLIFFVLIAEVGPVRATVITYVNPAVATVLGVTVLDETFTAGMGVGFVLVLIGSVLATSRKPEPAASPILAEP